MTKEKDSSGFMERGAENDGGGASEELLRGLASWCREGLSSCRREAFRRFAAFRRGNAQPPGEAGASRGLLCQEDSGEWEPESK